MRRRNYFAGRFPISSRRQQLRPIFRRVFFGFLFEGGLGGGVIKGSALNLPAKSSRDKMLAASLRQAEVETGQD
jgi:hypothetical protein